MIKVTVWNEFIHEQNDDKAKSIYPDGIHGEIASFLKSDEISVKTATLEEPDHGLSDSVLEDTDVLIWWGHLGHRKVSDEVVKKVCDRVLGGMGAIFLHSAHMSKPFLRLMGTTGSLKWRESGDIEYLWTVNPAHPIASGLPERIKIDGEEMYGEPFDIPEPDELVFMGWFDKGEVFRSGCCWRRGRGRVFYFQPGHETFPVYKNEYIRRIIKNAVFWSRPTVAIKKPECIHYTLQNHQ